MSRLINRRRSVTNVPPALSASTGPAVSAPMIGETTPLTEATPTAAQTPVSSTSSVSAQPLSARRPHQRRREPEPANHSSSTSRVEGEASQLAKKNTRGPSRMLNVAQAARQAGTKLKIMYDSRHRGAATSQQHNNIASSCGVIVEQNCPFQYATWAKIPDNTKKMLREKLSSVYDLEDISPEVMAYIDEAFATRYRQWKNNFHEFFKRWDNPEIARLNVPLELKDRSEDWEWLCNHFISPNFVKKSIAGKIARESKKLLHHSGSMPFSYRVEARREKGSMFPEIDMFKDVYVRPGGELGAQLHAAMVEKSTSVLQEATSQLPPETPIEDVTLPEDAGFQIMTTVLDQNMGRRHGKIARGMGKARVRETGACSSKSNTVEVNALREEVTTLRGQIAAQGDLMKTLVQAIQTSGISLPPPFNLTPPSTSEPSRPADT